MASKINCRLRLKTAICTNSHPEMTSKHCNRFLWLHKLWHIIKTSSSHSPIYSLQNCIYKILKNHITIPLFWRENWQKNTSHLCFLIERMLLLSRLLLKKVHHTHCPTFICVISKPKSCTNLLVHMDWNLHSTGGKELTYLVQNSGWLTNTSNTWFTFKRETGKLV
jgi:hypothetical protein